MRLNNFQEKTKIFQQPKIYANFLQLGFFRIWEIHICKFNRFSLSHSPMVGVFIMD